MHIGITTFGRGLIAASLGFMAILAAPSTASAKTYSAIGGAGDRQIPVQCNGGRYLAGLAGKVGGWIDQMSIECAKTPATGVVGPLELTYTMGGPGGSPMEDRCAPGQLVTGVRIYLTGDGKKVKELLYVCNPVGSSPRVTIGRPGQTVEGKRRHRIGFDVDGAGWGAVQDQWCPDNEYAVGFNARFGNHVNALGLICAPLPPPEIGVLTPIIVGPAPAPKPVPPPAVSELKIAGVWRTTTSSGGHFDIVLETSTSVGTPDPTLIRVSGNFSNTDGAHQYDGSMNGFMRLGTRTYAYNYIQGPEGEEFGSGTFYFSPDGLSLTGQGEHVSGDKKIPFKWNGTRVR